MKSKTLLGASVLSLAVVGVACMVPGGGTRAEAVTAVGDSATTELNAYIDDAVGISVTDPSEIRLNASAIGTTTSTISTTNNTGYKGTVTVKDEDTDTNMTNGDYKIPASNTITAGTSGWGISTDSGSTYKAMPASNGTAITIGSDTGLGNESYTVTYGVGASSIQHSGYYSDSVVYYMTAEVPVYDV